MRSLRFGRDLDESCSRARSTCEVLLDQRDRLVAILYGAAKDSWLENREPAAPEE